MKALKLIGFLSLVWVLAACGSVEDAPLEPQDSSSCRSFDWGVKKMSSAASKPDFARNVTAGPDGSIFVLGRTTHDLADSELDWDVFVSKYTPAGCVAWKTIVGTNPRLRDFTPLGGDDYPNKIAVDASGNVYVLFSRASGNYLVKFTPNGQQLWLKKVMGDGSSGGLGISPLGHLVITVIEDDHYILAYYDSNGNLIIPIENHDWHDIQGVGLTVGANGKIYVYGGDYFESERWGFLDVYQSNFNKIGSVSYRHESVNGVEVDSGGNIFLLSNYFHYSTFRNTLRKFTADLEEEVLNVVVSPDWETKRFYSLAIAANNVYLVGSTNYDLSNPTSRSRGVISKIPANSTTGTPAWTRNMYVPISGVSGVSDAYVGDVITTNGYIYAVGSVHDAYDTSSWPLIESSDGFIVRYDSSGNMR